MDNDFEIKEADSILAIEILLHTYDIDVMQWDREKLEHIAKLLSLALQSTKIKEPEGSE